MNWNFVFIRSVGSVEVLYCFICSQHWGWIFHGGGVNLTPASWKQCSCFPQSCFCHYWFFCGVSCHNTDFQCFSVGRTAPQNCPFPWGYLNPSNTLFFGPTTVYPPISIIISSTYRHTDGQTDRHTDHATPSVAIVRILCTECVRCSLSCY